MLGAASAPAPAPAVAPSVPAAAPAAGVRVDQGNIAVGLRVQRGAAFVRDGKSEDGSTLWRALALCTKGKGGTVRGWKLLGGQIYPQPGTHQAWYAPGTPGTALVKWDSGDSHIHWIGGNGGKFELAVLGAAPPSLSQSEAPAKSGRPQLYWP